MVYDRGMSLMALFILDNYNMLVLYNDISYKHICSIYKTWQNLDIKFIHLVVLMLRFGLVLLHLK